MATPSGEILNRKIADGGEVTKECGEIEEAIAALRMSYEQYFLGIERKPPTLEHNELKKRINKLRGGFIRQTALKFRIQSITAKFTTYERLWSRTLQEMENGTYRRDLFKARLHAEERSAKAKERVAKGKGATDTEPEVEAAAPPPPPQAQPRAAAAPPPPAAVRPPPSAAPPRSAAAAAASKGLDDALSDQKLKAVFNAYVTAKKQCREDVSKLSFDQVAANLRKQVPELVKKTGAQGVDFKVVIKDGKAILRAVPK